MDTQQKIQAAVERDKKSYELAAKSIAEWYKQAQEGKITSATARNHIAKAVKLIGRVLKRNQTLETYIVGEKVATVNKNKPFPVEVEKKVAEILQQAGVKISGWDLPSVMTSVVFAPITWPFQVGSWVGTWLAGNEGQSQSDASTSQSWYDSLFGGGGSSSGGGNSWHEDVAQSTENVSKTAMWGALIVGGFLFRNEIRSVASPLFKAIGIKLGGKRK